MKGKFFYTFLLYNFFLKWRSESSLQHPLSVQMIKAVGSSDMGPSEFLLLIDAKWGIAMQRSMQLGTTRQTSILQP